MKENKGITLIALVVTIIILIILAGISISMLFGENGIITKAKDAGDAYQLSESKEKEGLDALLDSLNDKFEEAGLPTYIPSENLRSESMYTKTIKSKYQDTTRNTNNVVTIPAGYRMTEDADKIDEGIVIEDASGNQWVWIPVDNPSEIYVELDEPTLLSGNTGVTTKYSSKGGILEGVQRGITGQTNTYREPDLATDYENSDTISTNILKAGFTDTENKSALVAFAEDISNSFYKMVESVKKYGGFYIARYEIGATIDNPKLSKGQTVLSWHSWYDLYNACSKFSNDKVTSRMIWDCLNDETWKFITQYGDTVSLTNGRYYGNFKDSESPANVPGYATRCLSGSSEYWKTHNIYDFAGNISEYSQGVYSTEYRSGNGGQFSWFGYNPYARGGQNPEAIIETLATRPVLFFND